MLASFSSRPGRFRAAAALVVATVFAIGGCTQPEIDRPGTWQPTGVNERNLRAMLVNPQDEYGGAGASTSRGDAGARAVTRLLNDKRRPLLNVSLSHLGGGGDSGDSGGAGGAAVSTP